MTRTTSRCLIWTACLVVGVSFTPALAAQTEDDEAAIMATVDLYLRSHATGEGEHVARAFHPELVMYFVRGGGLMSRTAGDYIAGFGGAPAANESERRRWIEMVDLTGSAAVAKVVLDYPQVRITDYFTLLKIDGEWKIMNKVFHSEPKSGGAP